MLNALKNKKQKSGIPMLSFKMLGIIFFSMMLFASCEKDSDEMAAPATANSGNASAKLAVSLPFTGTLNATVDVNSPNPPTSCSGDVPGFGTPDFVLSGTSTHLGLLNVKLSRLHHISCDLSASTMLLTTNVNVVLQSANGDLLYCSGNDVINVVSLLTATGTTGAITGTWTINGGTGRFTGARGSINISGLVDFAVNTFSCTCTGNITY
jgi:hypothetical protein